MMKWMPLFLSLSLDHVEEKKKLQDRSPREQPNHVHLLIVDNGFVEKHSNVLVQQATCRTEQFLRSQMIR